MKNCVEKIFGGLRGSYFSYALTYFSFYFGMGAFISVQSVYLMGLGKSTGEMSFIVSASSLFGIVLIPAVGYLNDRLKKPRLIAVLLLAAVAVLGAVFAASRSTWVLYVLNGLIMGLVSAISPVCERMAGSGRFRYGTVRVWGTIGYAAAAQLAGLVMEFIAPRMIFVLFGAAIAVAAAGFAGTDGIRFEQEAEKSTAADQLSFLSKPMFLLFAAIALVFSGMSNLNITYSPILLQELGLSTGFVGTALSLSTLVELPVILFSNRFMDRFSGRALTAAGFAVMLLQFLLYGFSSSAWLAFLSMLLLKAVGSTLLMMIMLKVVRGIVRENSVSTALGVINAANAVSTILMQNLGGFIVGALGIHTMYFLLAGLSALGLLLSLFLRVQNAKKVFS